MIVSYPNDLSDTQWSLIEPLFTDLPIKRGRKRWRDPRDIIDGVKNINQAKTEGS